MQDMQLTISWVFQRMVWAFCGLFTIPKKIANYDRKVHYNHAVKNDGHWVKVFKEPHSISSLRRTLANIDVLGNRWHEGKIENLEKPSAKQEQAAQQLLMDQFAGQLALIFSEAVHKQNGNIIPKNKTIHRGRKYVCGSINVLFEHLVNDERSEWQDLEVQFRLLSGVFNKTSEDSVLEINIKDLNLHCLVELDLTSGPQSRDLEIAKNPKVAPLIQSVIGYFGSDTNMPAMS